MPLSNFQPVARARGTLTGREQVKKAQVMYDPHTRESRGFGFVTMESAEEADAAITAMNGTELMGKNVSVEKVRLFRPAGC